MVEFPSLDSPVHTDHSNVDSMSQRPANYIPSRVVNGFTLVTMVPIVVAQ